MKQLSEWLACEPLAQVNREQWLKDIRNEAFQEASEMSCVNHVPACNCDVCAFKKRILRAKK